MSTHSLSQFRTLPPESSYAMPRALLHRQCACGQHIAAGGECDQCRTKGSILQHRLTGSIGSDSVPSSVHEVIRSSGEALDPATLVRMNRHFGHGFASIRVHTDAMAGASAEAVDARAYSVGQHIVFAPGQYRPQTPGGAHLLRHELAHTLQQSPNAEDKQTPLRIGSASDPLEAQAEQMALQPAWARSGIHSAVGRDATVLRRQQVNSTTHQASGSMQTGSPNAATSAPSATPATSSLREWAFGIEVGRVTGYTAGYADAHLDRSGLLATPQQGSEPAACELQLQLKLQFEFHLGSSPYRLGPTGQMTTPGAPWPQSRADQWKRNYMTVAQSMWHTRWPMVPANPCVGEPCKKANAHLEIIDVDSMTNAQGQQRQQLGDPAPKSPHVTIQVYEYRPKFGKDESRVGGRTATLYDEDVQPQNAPQPQSFDADRYTWRPGAASHETGHMLGRPHVSCPPGTPGDPNREECYGAPGSSERQNVMGRGQEFSREDQAPFLAAMRAITGCEWKTSAGGLPGWAVALIVVGSILAVGGAIAGIAAAVASQQH